MIKKSEIRKVVEKEFDESKSAGARKLRLRAANKYTGVSEKKILEVVKGDNKFRRFNARFTNRAVPRPVRAKEVMEQMQVDLVSMTSQQVDFNGRTYRYILSLMDIFSRFHWLAPLERKFSSHVALHLDKIFSEHGPPSRLQSDNGGEFKKEVKKVSIVLSTIYLYRAFNSFILNISRLKST